MREDIEHQSSATVQANASSDTKEGYLTDMHFKEYTTLSDSNVCVLKYVFSPFFF